MQKIHSSEVDFLFVKSFLRLRNIIYIEQTGGSMFSIVMGCERNCGKGVIVDDPMRRLNDPKPVLCAECTRQDQLVAHPEVADEEPLQIRRSSQTMLLDTE